MKVLMFAIVSLMTVSALAKSANDKVLCVAEVNKKFYPLETSTEPEDGGLLKVEVGTYTVRVSAFEQSYGITVISHIEESTQALEVSTGSSVINPKGVPGALVAGLEVKRLPRIGVYCETK